MKTPPILFLPDIENVDPEVKIIFEEYNKALEEFVTAVYSDITRLYELIGE